MLTPLERLLHTALKHTKTTCVLGANNRCSQREATGNWNEFIYDYNTYLGAWYPVETLPYLFEDSPAVNDSFRWQYVNAYPKERLMDLHLRNSSEDPPLDNPEFNLDESVKNTLCAAMDTMWLRTGKCRAQANVAFNYLWQHGSEWLTRIEIISMRDFDHALVLVNRKQNSIMEDPSTWGEDCYALDPWYQGHGHYFRAEYFFSEMFNTELDAIDEVYSGQKYLSCALVYRFDTCIDVNPREQAYPVYENYHDLNYYYDFSQRYFIESQDDEEFQDDEPEYVYHEQKEAHNQKFSAVLAHGFFKGEILREDILKTHTLNLPLG